MFGLYLQDICTPVEQHQGRLDVSTHFFTQLSQWSCLLARQKWQQIAHEARRFTTKLLMLSLPAAT
jgi:hypothetical protein